MKKKKWILILCSLCLLSGGVVFLGLIFRLNSRINNSLKKGWFQPPMEYYTAPEKITFGMTLSPNNLEKKLKRRYYTEISDKSQLYPGSFIFRKEIGCHNQKSNIIPEYCLFWQDLNTKEFFTVGFTHNKVSFLQKDQQPVDFVFLKPFLFAQYEHGEPILKQLKPLNAFPFHCLQAVLAAEDHQFITHEGISLKAITRAIWRNIKEGRLAEGGSTITQQLVKNIFFSPKKSFWRKFQEQIMALLLEKKMNKDQILTAYLNIVYMGQSGVFRIHGFGSAAEYYIGKPLSNLSLSECAFLAGLIKSPGQYKPSTDNTHILHRRNYILDTLYKKQIINQKELTAAKASPIIAPIIPSPLPVYFTDTVYKKIKQMGLPTKKGLKVFTTLHPDFQKKADQSIKQGLKWLENNRLKKELKKNHLQAALINVEISTGAIRAIVGGRDFKASQFNRAIQAKRQIGSLMKPVVVLSSLIEDPELNPLSIVDDTKFTHKYGNLSWSPKNYKERYKGKVPLYEVLTYSLNAGAARLGIKTDLNPLVNTIKKLGGGPTSITAHPSLILGALEMSPWEAAQMFLTIANMGKYKKQHIIQKVTDLTGHTLYEYEKKEKSELDPKKTAVLVGMLKEVTRSGTAQWLKNFSVPVAGKTGTTNAEKDAWFVGFTPETLTLVWLGFDDNQSHYLTGAEGALPLWEIFMKKILPSLSEKDFEWPMGVISRGIHSQTEDPKRDQEIQLVFEE